MEFCYGCSGWGEPFVNHVAFHVVSPNHECASSGAPSEKVVSEAIGYNDTDRLQAAALIHIPCILHDEPQVMTSGEFDPYLYVFDRAGVDPDRGDAPLPARHPKSGIAVTRLDVAARVSICFEGIELHRSWLI